MKMAFNRALALCLALVLALSLMAALGFAAEDSPFSLTVSDNGDGTWAVSLTCSAAVPDFGAADAVIDWKDQKNITLQSIEGVALKDLTANTEQGRFAACADDCEHGDSMAAGAVWVKYTFAVSDDIPSGTYTFTLTFENGVDVSFGKYAWAESTVTGSFAVEAASSADKAAVDAAKKAIEDAEWTVAQETANTETAVKGWVEGQIAKLGIGTVEAAVSMTSVIRAVEGTEDEPEGKDGSFGFTVALSLGGISDLATVTNGRITATAFVPPLTYQTALKATLAFIKAHNSSPRGGSSEWNMLALARGGTELPQSYVDGYVDSAVAFIEKQTAEVNDGEKLNAYKATDNARLIVALTSLGIDARNVDGHDLTAPLGDMAYLKSQGLNGPLWALIAMDTENYAFPTVSSGTQADRDGIIDYLLEKQLEDGGWSLSGSSADSDMTGMALQALAPYYEKNASVKAAVDKGVARLSSMQLADGAYETMPGHNETLESIAQVVVALSALGIDANSDERFVKNGVSVLDALLSFYVEGGGFEHVSGNGLDGMATEQGAYALVAYDRFKTGQTALYDMSDVDIRSPEEKANKAAAEEVEKLIDAIGEVTLESKAKIDAARAAYAALTDAQKALVGNLKTLTDAEAAYEKLKAEADQEEVDKAAAKGVEDLIEAIGKVTLESEKAIKVARAAYDALTDTQKALVKNLATLEDAEKQLKDMQEAAEILAAVTFHLRNGSSEEITDGEEKVYTKGDEGNDLPDASREGYEFQGWFDFPTDGTKYTKVSADLPEDLYAQWKSTSSGGGSSGSSETKIKVSFRLIGAEKADKKVDLGTEEYMPDYVTWIATTTYEMEEGDTVYDLWVKATHDRGIESEGADNNYVKTVYAPASLGGYALSEFTNGPRSGWMYTINGRHPGYGLVEQELKDGDRIIWHYVNDYAYEVADWIDDGQWQSLGDGRYYSRWLKARDEFGGAGGGLGEGAKAKNSGGSSGSGEVTDLTPSYDGDTVWISSEVDHSEGGMAYAADAELTKDIVTKGLEKAEDKSELKLWVDIQDSNRLVLQVDPDAMKEISDAGAGLRLQCSKGVIELDAETVAQLAESGRQVRMTVSYDDWNEKTKVSVGAFPPKDTDTPVTMKIELPVTKDGQALSIVNSDGSRTPIKKSAIIGDRAYAEVTGAVTLEITDIHKYWNDVKEKDWFANAVQFAVSHELMNGVDRYEFAPNAPMTRAMLVTVLYRLEDQSEITGSGSSFGDVDADGWYAEAVAWASENGLVNGTEKGFEPNANISREQIATILYRYAKHIGLLGQDDAVSGDVSKFEDRESVSPWAQEAMAWAVEVGLFKGDDTNSLNPQGEATRAEVATLLERLIKLIVLS